MLLSYWSHLKGYITNKNKIMFKFSFFSKGHIQQAGSGNWFLIMDKIYSKADNNLLNYCWSNFEDDDDNQGKSEKTGAS